MPGKVLGIVDVKKDGTKLRILPGASVDLGGVNRKAVVGDGVVHGFAEETRQAELKCEISLAPGDSLAEINATTDATLRFETDTGQTYQIAHAFLTEPAVVTGGEGGKIPLVFQGDPAEEIT